MHKNPATNEATRPQSTRPATGWQAGTRVSLSAAAGPVVADTPTRSWKNYSECRLRHFACGR